jgi:hypothetical protein
MGLITPPHRGCLVPTGLIHRNRIHMLPEWKRSLLVASMRAKPTYMIPCFMERAQALLIEERFQEAAAFLLPCAPKIHQVVKKNNTYSRGFQAYYSEAVDRLLNMVFRSITERCATSLTEEMLKKVFDSFSNFVRITQLKPLSGLLHPDADVRTRAVERAKRNPPVSRYIANLFVALSEEHNKNYQNALNILSHCDSITQYFAKFRMACIMLDGKAGKKDDGMKILEELRDNSYPLAITYWLKQLLSGANTPEGIKEAFHKLVQCPGWEKFMPEVKWKLLANLKHQIKQIKHRLISWEKALEEQQNRAFWHFLQEKCPPERELSATEGRIVKNEKSVAAHQTEVAEAQRIYDELRILYETEKKAAGKKKREETKVGGKRERGKDELVGQGRRKDVKMNE